MAQFNVEHRALRQKPTQEAHHLKRRGDAVQQQQQQRARERKGAAARRKTDRQARRTPTDSIDVRARCEFPRQLRMRSGREGRDGRGEEDDDEEDDGDVHGKHGKGSETRPAAIAINEPALAAKRCHDREKQHPYPGAT